jgi:hypothetical protein
VKALVLPERVDVGRNVLPAAQADQRRHVLVSDCRSRERLGKDAGSVGGLVSPMYGSTRREK